jgi:cytoplasmic polyadenylation element-binding protein
VIPWVVSDASFVPVGPPAPLATRDTRRTVFVGALHGMITAQVLFGIMEELFGEVVAVAIDTDKFKYPIGVTL